MKEELLQLIWKQRLFISNQLLTTAGEAIEIIHPGQWNHLSGPDFLDAKIRIDGTLWVGSVEIHVSATDWRAHGHSKDDNYKNVILHVVLRDDATSKEGMPQSPVLELKERIPASVLEKHDFLLHSAQSIPCANHIKEVPSLLVHSWIERVLVQRLERKTKDVELVFEQCDRDWTQAFFVLLAGYFGQNQNRQPFEAVANAVSLKSLVKLSAQPSSIRAILFGVSNLMVRLSEHEQSGMVKEYAFQKNRLRLKEIEIPWKYGRIRPASAPRVRMDQLAGLIPVLQEVLQAALHGNLANWKESVKYLVEAADLKFSDAFLDLLFVNAVVPFVFFHASYHGNDSLRQACLSSLENVPAEKNSITKRWSKLDIQVNSASDSQALIELYHHFCEQKKCVLCRIGQQIMSPTL